VVFVEVIHWSQTSKESLCASSASALRSTLQLFQAMSRLSCTLSVRLLDEPSQLATEALQFPLRVTDGLLGLADRLVNVVFFL
jgi:hypothetical protein